MMNKKVIAYVYNEEFLFKDGSYEVEHLEQVFINNNPFWGLLKDLLSEFSYKHLSKYKIGFSDINCQLLCFPEKKALVINSRFKDDPIGFVVLFRILYDMKTSNVVALSINDEKSKKLELLFEIWASIICLFIEDPEAFQSKLKLMSNLLINNCGKLSEYDAKLDNEILSFLKKAEELFYDSEEQPIRSFILEHSNILTFGLVNNPLIKECRKVVAEILLENEIIKKIGAAKEYIDSVLRGDIPKSRQSIQSLIVLVATNNLATEIKDKPLGVQCMISKITNALENVTPTALHRKVELKKLQAIKVDLNNLSLLLKEQNIVKGFKPTYMIMLSKYYELFISLLDSIKDKRRQIYVLKQLDEDIQTCNVRDELPHVEEAVFNKIINSTMYFKNGVFKFQMLADFLNENDSRTLCLQLIKYVLDGEENKAYEIANSLRQDNLLTPYIKEVVKSVSSVLVILERMHDDLKQGIIPEFNIIIEEDSFSCPVTYTLTINRFYLIRDNLEILRHSSSTIAEKLTALVNIKNLSASKIAVLSGIDLSSVCHILSGHRVPMRENLGKICDALGVSIDLIDPLTINFSSGDITKISAMPLGGSIRHVRERLRFVQDYLASIAGLTKTTIYNAEGGYYNTPDENIALIAKAFPKEITVSVLKAPIVVLTSGEIEHLAKLSIADSLIFIRNKYKWTIEEMSIQTGISEKDIRNIENGKSVDDLREKLQQIVKRLDINIYLGLFYSLEDWSNFAQGVSASNDRFGIKLKTFREFAGLSLRDLAKKSGIDLNTILKVEKGVRKYVLPTSLEFILKAISPFYKLELTTDFYPLAKKTIVNMRKKNQLEALGIAMNERGWSYRVLAEKAGVQEKTLFQIRDGGFVFRGVYENIYDALAVPKGIQDDWFKDYEIRKQLFFEGLATKSLEDRIKLLYRAAGLIDTELENMARISVQKLYATKNGQGYVDQEKKKDAIKRIADAIGNGVTFKLLTRH